MRVKIVGFDKKSYWYSDKLGLEFDVVDFNEERYALKSDGLSFIDKTDCIVLPDQTPIIDPTALPENGCKVVGVKYDQDKLDWSLLPLEPIEDVVDVLTFGAKKYSADNWKQVPDLHDRYYAAAMRHITAWRKGEIKDPESGRPHLAHAQCCLIFLAWFDKQGESNEY